MALSTIVDYNVQSCKKNNVPDRLPYNANKFSLYIQSLKTKIFNTFPLVTTREREREREREDDK